MVLSIQASEYLIVSVLAFVLALLVSSGLVFTGIRQIRQDGSSERSKREMYDYYKTLKLQNTKEQD
jgi:hypothetical protein